MAELTKNGTPSLSSQIDADDKLNGIAGEDIAAGDLCYLKASDGKIWRASGAAATAPARVRGVALLAAKAGRAITLGWGHRMAYGSGLTVAADVYLSGTVAGGLADAASTGGVNPVGFVMADGIRIQFFDIR